MKSAALLPENESAVVSLPVETQAVAHGIVSRTVLATSGMRAVLFSFAAGQQLTEHTNTARALILVLNGTCEFSVAGQPRILKAGDLLHLPPNVPHSVNATEAFSMLLTLVPEPPAG
ncbi:MAG: cupin domain-containing protein [Opitutaceae bacterium]|nr:cupin domain-containing protein [Opitutaceae bacterium]